MLAADIHTWSAISADAERLLTILGAKADVESALAGRHIPSLSLRPRQEQPAMMDSLRQIGLSAEAASKCEKIYVQKCLAAARHLEQDYHSACKQLAGVHAQEAELALWHLYNQTFTQSIEECQQEVFAAGRQRLAASALPAQTSAVLPESEQKPFNGKTNPQAKKILEAAFAMKDTITKMEKRELAVACGMSENQVTVWFNNHRQRRKKKPYADPRSSPEPQGGSSRSVRGLASRKTSSTSISSLDSSSSFDSSYTSASVQSLSSSTSSTLSLAASIDSIDLQSSSEHSSSPLPELDFDQYMAGFSLVHRSPSMEKPVKSGHTPDFFATKPEPQDWNQMQPDFEPASQLDTLMAFTNPSTSSSLSLTEPQATMPLQLPTDQYFSQPQFGFPVDNGITDDFLAELQRICGPDRSSTPSIPEQMEADPFASLTITSAADDWSRILDFSNVDFGLPIFQ